MRGAHAPSTVSGSASKEGVRVPFISARIAATSSGVARLLITANLAPASSPSATSRPCACVGRRARGVCGVGEDSAAAKRQGGYPRFAPWGVPAAAGARQGAAWRRRATDLPGRVAGVVRVGHQRRDVRRAHRRGQAGRVDVGGDAVAAPRARAHDDCAQGARRQARVHRHGRWSPQQQQRVVAGAAVCAWGSGVAACALPLASDGGWARWF